MPLSISEELRRTFELATLRKEAKDIRKPDQWRVIEQLRLRCGDARTKEKDLYAGRYLARVEQRRRKLIDEAGAVHRGLTPWGTGVDRFNPEDTLRQAQREVRLAHAGRLDRIDDYERKQLSLIVERYRRENGVRERVMADFGRAADRRSGIERRNRIRDR
jgi:hypothetical protein